MRRYTKEIVGCIIAVLCMAIGIFLLYRSNEKGKIAEEWDLYELILPEAESLLVINRPSVLRQMILPKEEITVLFSKALPSLFFSVLQENILQEQTILSFHPQGVVLYTKTKDNQTFQYLNKLLNAYPPQIQPMGELSLYYFADVNNQFLGFYEYEGICVASYSRKLLEEVASRQLKGQNIFKDNYQEEKKLFNKKEPLNLLYPSDSLNLFILMEDSTRWEYPQRWLAVDLFESEGRICSFSNLAELALPDTLIYQLADTLSMRLQAIHPLLDYNFQIELDEDVFYITGCKNISEEN